ncbi:hypothetical protein PVK06_048391 [Gossypium arboreum]|uniref:Uncharacterized protein n=1 Tax=Gossypium arboreum TaxID=29729 RepID=A0ABR0MFY3_GOSAR|nr:hypothetical protein PVK06_048391 [Gossypium arboreum]
MFLDELKDILEEIDMVEFQKVMVPLSWQIGRCINSFHFQLHVFVLQQLRCLDNVRKMFMDIDDGFFMSCLIHLKEEKAELSKSSEKRKKAWERLENTANHQPPTTRNTAALVTHSATSIS